MIVNPAARSGRSLPRLIDEADTALRQRGFSTQIETTQRPLHAQELASISNANLVVAAGGDGTVNEVASGLLQNADPAISMAVLPAGTGNDVARLLGIGSVEAAVAALDGRRTISWDVIEIECQCGGAAVRRHALLFAGAGFVGDVIRQTTPRVKAWFGPSLSYAVGFFRALIKHQPMTLKVRAAGFHYDGPLLAALAANATHAGGGGMRLGPGALMDDGVFDVSVIRSVSRAEVTRQFIRLTRGTHIRHRAVNYFPASWLEIDSDQPRDVVADGELVGSTPVRFTLRPQALRLLGAFGNSSSAKVL